MKKVPVLSVEIFALYWRRNLQLRSANLDIIRLFLLSASDRGDNMNEYHVNSTMSANYNVNDLLSNIVTYTMQ